MVLIRYPVLFALLVQIFMATAQQDQQPAPRVQLQNLDTDLTAVDKQVREIAADDQIGVNYTSQAVSPQQVEHTRFQVTKNGIPVEGATFSTHGRSGRIDKLNGIIPQGQYAGSKSIAAAEAIAYALDAHQGDVYAWQDAVATSTLREVRKDASATFYPNPELVYVDMAYPEASGNYRLAYKFEIYSLQPLSRKKYFVDAENGDILHKTEQIHTTNVEGLAHTKYSGERTITTDSISPNRYELNETTRGGGIETLNMQKSIFYDYAVPFTDSNNVWDNVNDNQDEVATDAHWGMEMTYDYYSQKHNWKSYDNNDAKMIAYVHYARDYGNAFWNGTWTTYGDGAGPYDPFTSVDVVGHEFTHGVVDYTSDLVYRNESGALNESFCDIFGSCIEYFASPEQFDWYIGEDFINNGIRSMSDPKSQGDPDTYQGQHWEFGNFDNGGVHINSGVQNKWFYLMVEGGSGTNDNGDSYSVDGIGMDSAAAIAFYNLRYYLNNFSNYDDARWGAIHAAIELYGIESPAVKTVMDAWHAVGLGQPSGRYDVELTRLVQPVNNGCQLANNEPIRLELTMNSVNDTIFQGDSILVGYQFHNDSLQTQYIHFQDDFGSFDQVTTDPLSYLDLAEPGKKDFMIYIHYPEDTNGANDTFRIEFNTAQHQVVNIGVRDILMPNEACVDPEGEDVRVRLRYYGCDSFAPRQVPVSYTLDGSNFAYDTINVANAIYPGQNYDFTFSEGIIYPSVGQHTITIGIDLPADSINTNNNTDSKTLKRSHIYTPGERISFESSTNSTDSLYFSTGRDAEIAHRGEASSKGLYGLMLTGGDIIQDRHRYNVVDSSDIWSSNGRFRSEACACVDAGDYSNEFDLIFDLKQTYSPSHKVLIFQDYPLASSFRLKIDGQQVTPTYHPETYFDDEFQTYTLPLDSLAGRQFEVCFEARNFIGRNGDIDTGRGDNAYLDQIIFRTEPVGVAPAVDDDGFSVNLYPNPVAGNKLIVSGAGKQLTGVQIFSVDGKRYEAQLTNDNNIAIDHLPAGYYLLKVHTQDAVAVERFIRVK